MFPAPLRVSGFTSCMDAFLVDLRHGRGAGRVSVVGEEGRKD